MINSVAQYAEWLRELTKDNPLIQPSNDLIFISEGNKICTVTAYNKSKTHPLSLLDASLRSLIEEKIALRQGFKESEILGITKLLITVLSDLKSN